MTLLKYSDIKISKALAFAKYGPWLKCSLKTIKDLKVMLATFTWHQEKAFKNMTNAF